MARSCGFLSLWPRLARFNVVLMQEMAGEHRVLVVGHPGVHGMELLGVRDMFEFATYLGVQTGQLPAYQVEVASVDGAPLDLGRD